MSNKLAEKGRVFDAIDENGEEIECEIIMSYVCDINQKAYVFYTDNKYDEEGNLNLYASRYLGEDNGNIELESIVDEDEWRLLDKALESAKEGLINEG